MSASTPSYHNVLRFEDVRFRSVMRTHDDSIFLGFADATLVVEGALPDGSDLLLRVRSVEVKVVRGNDGDVSPRIDFKSEKGQNGTWYPILFPKSAETRTALTNAILKDRFVSAVVISVIEDLDAGRMTFAA